MADNKIIHLFTDVHMIYGHDSLKALALKKKVKLSELAVGEFALFVNRARTAMKAFGANNVVIYYRSPSNRPIDIRAFQYLPQFISGADIGYDAAISKLIQKKYPQLFTKAEK